MVVVVVVEEEEEVEVEVEVVVVVVVVKIVVEVIIVATVKSACCPSRNHSNGTGHYSGRGSKAGCHR